MAFATYPKSESEAYCKSCKHTNLANEDGSCSGYGYNGVDCQPQPCICREHSVTVHHKESPTTTPPSLTEQAQQRLSQHSSSAFLGFLGTEPFNELVAIIASFGNEAATAALEQTRRDTLEFLKSAVEQLGFEEGAQLTVGHLQAQLGITKPFDEIRKSLKRKSVGDDRE